MTSSAKQIQDGGAILSSGSSTASVVLQLKQCTVSSNMAIEDGGAFNLKGRIDTTLERCTISSNVAMSSLQGGRKQGGSGGAFYLDRAPDGADLWLKHCTISSNEAGQVCRAVP